MQMMHSYIKSRQHARAVGDRAAVAKYKQLADECYVNYLKASASAKTRIIEQTYPFLGTKILPHGGTGAEPN